MHQSYKQNSCTQSRYWEIPKIFNHVIQKISTSQRWQMHLRVSSAPLQSKRSSSIQQLLCCGDSARFLSFDSLIKYFFDLDPFTSTQPMPVHLNECPRRRYTNGMGCTRVWCLFRQNVTNSPCISSGAGKKEAQKTLRVVFPRKRLGRCSVTCSSFESVQQAGSNICSLWGLLWCSEQMF